jgi:Flp pilus assembly CpaE family ATPase
VKETLTVLLIEDDPDYAAIVQAWLSAKSDTGFAINWTDTLLDGVERLSQGGIDIIVLDLGLPDSNGAETFHVVHSHVPNIPVVLLSAVSDESLAMELVRAGAEDYLVKETCRPEQLVRALVYGVLRRENAPQTSAAGQSATILGVLPVKGGVGATTFACTLAAEFRRQTQQETLLVDLDLHSNAVSFLLGLETKYSIADALANTHRLDRSVWDSIVGHGPEELHVLTSAALYGRRPAHLETLRHMLNRIRIYYSWIVLDLGRLDEISRALLDSLDHVLVVTSTSISSLYQTKQIIAALQTSAADANKFQLVAGALSSEKVPSESALQQLVPLALSAYLPPSAAEIADAATNKVLPAVHSRYREAVSSLARSLAGLPRERTRGTLAQILALGGIRLRTTQSHTA